MWHLFLKDSSRARQLGRCWNRFPGSVWSSALPQFSLSHLWMFRHAWQISPAWVLPQVGRPLPCSAACRSSSGWKMPSQSRGRDCWREFILEWRRRPGPHKNLDQKRRRSKDPCFSKPRRQQITQTVATQNPIEVLPNQMSGRPDLGDISTNHHSSLPLRQNTMQKVRNMRKLTNRLATCQFPLITTRYTTPFLPLSYGGNVLS